MWKLNKPSLNAKSVFTDSISNKKSISLRTKLLSCSSDIYTASEDFELKVSSSKTHEISKMHHLYDIVERSEWPKVYDNNFAKSSSIGRKYYDLIMSIPRFSRCPICAQRDVSTLDHYLPKTEFPALVLSPLNLIPCCSDCNKLKGNIVFDDISKATIHPYFDDIDTAIWLKAEIIESSEPTFRFFVVRPNSWPSILFDRMQNHFNLFKLGKLYSSHSSQELYSIQYELSNLYIRGGKSLVKLDILDRIQGRERLCLNSWELAMYRAIYSSNWFYDEWLHTKAPSLQTT